MLSSSDFLETSEMESAAADTVNWTEAVEDLVAGGEVDKAINLLEAIVSKLAETDSKSDQLSAALLDLSKLYASQGLSLKADDARSRAFVLKQQLRRDADIANTSSRDGSSENFGLRNGGKEISESSNLGKASNLQDNGSQPGSCSDDDWEAMADCDPNELLSPTSLPEVSNLSLQDSEVQVPKRRGRGTFFYQKHGLYSDEQSEGTSIDERDNEVVSDNTERGVDTMTLKYGTRHVLVLADFPPSTQTADLEKLLEKHKVQAAIRWVNDTVALAVFRTPSLAQEASRSIQWPYSMRILEENDELLKSILPRDLEPPRQRPQTSARTAQRLIAQSMGIRLPSNFGSRELRKQEEARKSRIVSRQNMKEDAWGDE